MKTLLRAFALLAASATFAFASGDGWLTDIDAAKAKAKEEGRPILVDFTGSDWCGWCIKLQKEVFTKKAFKDYAKDNLVLLEIDFPRKSDQTDEEKKANKELAKKYEVRGYPTILLIDAKGKVLAKTGYKEGGPDAYVTHIKGLIEKSDLD